MPFCTGSRSLNVHNRPAQRAQVPLRGPAFYSVSPAEPQLDTAEAPSSWKVIPPGNSSVLIGEPELFTTLIPEGKWSGSSPWVQPLIFGCSFLGREKG